MTTHKKHLPHSSSISHCEFDDEKNEMHITFASGGRHKFTGVTKEDYEALSNADSPGKHFHIHIRRKFDSVKVD